MKLYTPQEILNEGVAFILAQEKRCMINRGCAYINDAGERCVAGHFMSEGLCRAVEVQQSGGSIDDVLSWIADPVKENLEGDFTEDYEALKHHESILCALQGLHDGWDDRSETAPFNKVERLALTARTLGLTMPTHERLGNLNMGQQS